MSNSITSRIRKSRAAVSAILLAFVVGYLSPYMSEIGYNIFSPSKVNVGSIAGNIIPYYPDYRYRFDSLLREEVEMYGHYEGIEANVHRKTWESFILENAFKRTYDLLGIGVLSEERQDMFLGNDVPIHIQHLPLFQDPKTKQFSKGRYLTFLKGLANRPGGVAMWTKFEKNLVSSRFQDKFKFLIRKSTRIPRFFKKKGKKWQKSATVRYVYIPYSSISDNRVRNTVNEQDKLAYHKAKQKKFVQEQSKEMEYVIFPVLFSTQDVKKAQQELESLKGRFAKEKDPEAFAKLYSDKPDEVLVQLEKEALPEYIKAHLAKLKKKETLLIGPIREGDSCILYRYMGVASDDSWFIKNNKEVHQFIKIERKVAISQHSNDKKLKEAREFVNKVKATKKWKETAEQDYGLHIYKGTVTHTQATKIAEGGFRALIRWLSNDAKLRVPSPVIELRDGYYVVAIMTKENKAGIAPLTEVKDQVERALFNKRKADIIIGKLTEINSGNLPLQKIAEAYGANASIGEQTVSFNDNKLSDNIAPRAIGSLFALKVGGRTQCIEDENGIYILQRLPDSDQSTQKDKEANNQEEKDKEIMNGEIDTVMRFILEHYELIKDLRYRFYD